MGWFIFGIGPAIIFLRDDLHLSRAAASAHSLAMSIGGITAGLIGQRLTHKFGRGWLLRSASLVFASGITLFCLADSIYLTMAGVTITLIGVATVVQSTAAYLSGHHGRAAPAAISELHGAAAGFGLLSPVVIGVCVTYGFGWRLGLAFGALAILIVEFLRGIDTSKYGIPFELTETESQHDAPGSLPRAFWWAATAMICTSGVEYAVLLWSSDYLRTNGGFAKGASAIALGCVVGAMAVGRFLGSALTRRISAEHLYLGSLALALVGFLAFWSSTNSIALVTCLTLTGLGLSLHFPFGIDRAIIASAGRADKAASRIAIATGISGGVAPFAIGLLADHIGVRSAFLVVPSALALAILVATKNPVRR